MLCCVYRLQASKQTRKIQSLGFTLWFLEEEKVKEKVFFVFCFICAGWHSGSATGHRAAHRERGLGADAVRRPAPRCRCLRQWLGERLDPADHPQPGPPLEKHLCHVHGEEDEVSSQEGLKIVYWFFSLQWLEGSYTFQSSGYCD